VHVRHCSLLTLSSGLWGIVGEVVLDVYIFGSGFLLAGPGGFSYGVVRQCAS
jgi:hypothetical protein